MNNKGLFLFALIISIMFGCKSQIKELGQNEALGDSKTTFEPVEIGFYEVYRLQDKTLLQFLRNIKEVDQFIPIFNLDYGNYPQNVVGITESDSNKTQILEQLLLTDSISSNSKLVWSKRKQFNMRTNEEAFHLYMLKKDSRNISNSDIKSAEAKKNPYGEDYIIDILFNEIGTKKWSNMTKKAYEDDRNYIAIMLNEEVYYCPYVMGQLDYPNFSLNEFRILEEANKLAKGIMKKVDNK